MNVESAFYQIHYSSVMKSVYLSPLKNLIAFSKFQYLISLAYKLYHTAEDLSRKKEKILVEKIILLKKTGAERVKVDKNRKVCATESKNFKK